MAAVDIIVGSVYGSAFSVAETLEEALVGAGHEVTLHEEAELSDLDTGHFWLWVTSTTGQGELPPNLLPLFEEMRERCPPMPQLRYALATLGDSSYEDFCGAGVQVDALLQELQAQAVTDGLEVDASETLDPEEPALIWLSSWIEKI
ncbi:flavodoxin [Oceanisphaera marina]|uniref:Flavodoxin n=1 Tax=Oceanisphaera marina TaxID=2017550 RepID=A0ABQ1II04_9GAMM|nr:flavodoxin [Oceanisphaera marina]GGB38892.1 flavodoxin [Oceanisphaera marina]